MALLDTLFNVKEAAARLGLSDSRVRQICIEHDIGTKSGLMRFLSPEDLDAIRALAKPVGRPRNRFWSVA